MGEIESEGGAGKVSARRVFRYLQIDTGRRAFAVGMLRDIKKRLASPLLVPTTQCPPMRTLRVRDVRARRVHAMHV